MIGVPNGECLTIDEIIFCKETNDPFSDSIRIGIKGTIFNHTINTQIYINLSEVFSRKIKLSLEKKLTERLLERVLEVKKIVSKQETDLTTTITVLIQ